MDFDTVTVMEKNMKCTNCGGTELAPCEIRTSGMGSECHVTGNVSNTITYYCKKCRHVEFFLSEAEIQSIALHEKKDADDKEQIRQYEEKKAALQKEFEELQRIISDENQTVKAVNDAKSKIADVDYELRTLRKPGGNPHDIW